MPTEDYWVQASHLTLGATSVHAAAGEHLQKADDTRAGGLLRRVHWRRLRTARECGRFGTGYESHLGILVSVGIGCANGGNRLEYWPSIRFS